MDQKPRYLNFYGIAIFTLSLWFPIKALMLSNTFAPGFWGLFFQLHPLQWVAMGTCWLLAIFSLRASPHLKTFVALLFVSVALHHLVGLKDLPASSLKHESWSSITLVLLSLPLFLGTSGKILSNPRLRWWLVPRRYLIEVPVHMRTLQGVRFNLRSFDLSDTGIFLAIPDQALGAASPNVALKFFSGKRVSLRVSSERLREINLEGMIVRFRSSSHGHYPAGVGIRFLDMDSQSKSELKRLIRGYNSQPSYLRP